MKYTFEYLKKIGISIISVIDDVTLSPKFIFQHKDGYLQTYKISRTDIEDIKANGMFVDMIIDRIVNNFLKDYSKYITKIRKEKIEKLNEIQTQSR